MIQLYRGLPIVLAAQFSDTTSGAPINTTNYVNLAVWAKNDPRTAISMVVTPINAEGGAYSISITETKNLTLGEYQIQAYWNKPNDPVTYATDIGSFELIASVRYG